MNIDGEGQSDIDTNNAFVDHLLTSMSRHSMIDISIRAKSRDSILHHLIEDTAITLGMAISEALGERHGVARFAHARVPMDESLAEVVVDLVKRPYFVVQLDLKGHAVEGVAREDILHMFTSLIQNMEACVHVRIMYGENDHHKAEAATKAFAVALRRAAAWDKGRQGAPSTKGTM